MLAQALETPFELSQPAGQVLAFVLFLIPGLNCTWIIERLAGRTPLSGTERLFRAIAWEPLDLRNGEPVAAAGRKPGGGTPARLALGTGYRPLRRRVRC